MTSGVWDAVLGGHLPQLFGVRQESTLTCSGAAGGGMPWHKVRTVVITSRLPSPLQSVLQEQVPPAQVGGSLSAQLPAGLQLSQREESTEDATSSGHRQIQAVNRGGGGVHLANIYKT